MPSLIGRLAETSPDAREPLFRQWMRLPLREQWADLRSYLCDDRADTAARLSWKHYRKLPPPWAADFEKRLFMCDIEAMLAVVRDEVACPAEGGIPDVFEHVGRDLGTSLKVIGAAIGLSARALGARFSQRTGMTFQRYRCLERVRHGIEALRDRERSIKEAALLAGYTDPSNLIRDFRKVLGTTPDRFRREVLARSLDGPRRELADDGAKVFRSC